MKITETIATSQYTKDVEIISLHERWRGMIVLLRIKSMPEFAFVMRSQSKVGGGTASQMAIRLCGGGSYSDKAHSEWFEVVCACCQRNNDLLDEMARLCPVYGINTLFMRRAETDKSQYRDRGINLVEANKHCCAMEELYGKKPVKESLEFIDYLNSRGL